MTRLERALLVMIMGATAVALLGLFLLMWGVR